jgi:hypothetical protein
VQWSLSWFSEAGSSPSRTILEIYPQWWQLRIHIRTVKLQTPTPLRYSKTYDRETVMCCRMVIQNHVETQASWFESRNEENSKRLFLLSPLLFSGSGARPCPGRVFFLFPRTARAPPPRSAAPGPPRPGAGPGRSRSGPGPGRAGPWGGRAGPPPARRGRGGARDQAKAPKRRDVGPGPQGPPDTGLAVRR